MNKYFPFYLRNLKLAFPIILSQIGQVLVQQVDTMMVGYVGTEELAASAFANSVFFIGMVIVMGFTFGITPIVGHLVSENNKTKLSGILSNAIIVNTIFTIVAIGRLDKIKGFDKLIDQVSKLELPYKLELIGDGIELDNLRQLAKQKGISKKIDFLGYREDIPSIISNSDFLGCSIVIIDIGVRGKS